MLSILVIITSILMSIPLFIIFTITSKTYDQYRLKPFLMLKTIALFSILYLLATLAGNLSPSKILAFYLFNTSIMLIGMCSILTYLFFRILRTEQISKGVILLLGLLLISKIPSLILNPIRVYVYGDIIIREAHISLIALIPSTLSIILIAIEASLLYRDSKKTPSCNAHSHNLLLAYLFPMSLPPIYLLGHAFEIISILVPYLEGLVVSMIASYLAITFRRAPHKLVLLPVHVRAFLLHTHAGLKIMEIAFDTAFKNILALASSLIASIIGLEMAIEGRVIAYIFRVHRLSENVIIMFFGKHTVGTFITNRENSVIRDILRNIVLEFEATEILDEGIIMDPEIEKAHHVLDKYMDLIL